MWVSVFVQRMLNCLFANQSCFCESSVKSCILLHNITNDKKKLKHNVGFFLKVWSVVKNFAILIASPRKLVNFKSSRQPIGYFTNLPLVRFPYWSWNLNQGKWIMTWEFISIFKNYLIQKGLEIWPRLINQLGQIIDSSFQDCLSYREFVFIGMRDMQNAF